MDTTFNLLVILLSYLVFENQAQTTVTTTMTATYTGMDTTVHCPIEKAFTLPRWSGPPVDTSDNSRTTYTIEDLYIINPVIEHRVSYASNNRSIIVSNTEITDAGVYVCTKLFGANVYQGENTVIVRVRPAVPEVSNKEALDNIVIVRGTEGHQLTLTCTSKGGNPAPMVVWYRDSISGWMLASSSSGIPEGDTYTVVLNYIFTPTAEDDGRVYICRVYYPVPLGFEDSQEENITLHLYLKPSVPIVTQPNGTTVQCTTSGSRPAATISWLYKSVHFTPPVVATPDTSGTFSTLSTFPRQLTATDNLQTILCVVTHQTLVAPTPRLSKDAILDVTFPPQSVVMEGNRVIVANGINTLTLTCISGTSKPAADITWVHNVTSYSANNLPNQPGEYGGTIHSSRLILTPTRINDGDIISCTTRNSASGTNVVMNQTILNLNYCPHIDGTTIQGVVEGQTAILTCIASGKPSATFKWYKGSDSTVLDEGGGTIVGKNKEQRMYTIPEVKREQAGIYTCTAENGISECGQPEGKTGILNVFFPPDITVDTKTSYGDESVTMRCNAVGFPDTNYKYKWKLSWPGFGVVSEWNDSTPDLVLNKPTYQHSGIYTCMASNGIRLYGTDTEYMEGSGNLQVEFEPVPILPPPDQAIAVELLLNDISAIHIKYYSNIAESFVTYARQGQPIEDGVLIQPAILKHTPIDLPVFTHTVAAIGTQATIHITILNNSGFGDYHVKLTNEVGTVSIPLNIKQKSNSVNKGLSVGAVVGGVAGGLLVVCLIVAVIVYFRHYQTSPCKDDVSGPKNNHSDPASHYDELGLDRQTSRDTYEDLHTHSAENPPQTYANTNV